MENKEVKISFWASHLTLIVSVTMVLLLVGTIGLVWIGATNETRRLKERMELCAVMTDSVGNAKAQEIGRKIRSYPFAQNVKVITKEVALKRWTEETGENLMELYGVNPLSPEVSFTLVADWSSPDSIESVKREIASIPEVDSVAAPDGEMVEAMNSNIAGLTLILGLVAVVMLVISFVLINNTVQLTIYSRRFTIHTMQLVGATNGFIRRPVVLNSALCGVLAGILASAVLAGILGGAPHVGIGDIASYIGWDAYAFVAGSMTLLGIVLCMIASLIATTMYLRKDYDELFK